MPDFKSKSSMIIISCQFSHSNVQKFPAKSGFSERFPGSSATTATLFVLPCLLPKIRLILKSTLPCWRSSPWLWCPWLLNTRQWRTSTTSSWRTFWCPADVLSRQWTHPPAGPSVDAVPQPLLGILGLSAVPAVVVSDAWSAGISCQVGTTPPSIVQLCKTRIALEPAPASLAVFPIVVLMLTTTSQQTERCCEADNNILYIIFFFHHVLLSGLIAFQQQKHPHGPA